jgi:formylglycine-generating enzyme
MKKIYFTIFIILLRTLVYGQEEPEMVTVKGGWFYRGNEKGNGFDDESPVRHIRVDDFRMSKYELTVGEFAAFVNATGYKTEAEKENYSYIFNGGCEKGEGVNWRDDEEGRERSKHDWNKPVVHVSWNDAVAYCQWLTGKTGKKYRLPTEAEWEYAAGNGAKHTKYSWGSYNPGAGDKQVGNVADETPYPKTGKAIADRFTGYHDSKFFAANVGSYPPNDLGLYDMTGNVWEWCEDVYDAHYYEKCPADNPKGPDALPGSHHVVHGGCWANGPSHSRIARRGNPAPPGTDGNRRYDIGFRIVSSL